MDNNQIIETIKGLASLVSGSPLEIRTGNAVELHEPEVVKIDGVIDTPAKWLEKKVVGVDVSKAHVEVDREKMTIVLVTNEESYYHNTIKGKLVMSPEFNTFGINSGNYLNGVELSDKIRMNRSCFLSKEQAMKLVTTLRNFKATVNKQLENSDDKRGNRAIQVRQIVETEQPASFDIAIPIFRGRGKQRFTVEVDIDADSLEMTLVSPDAKDIIDESKNEIINSVLEQIKEAAPDIAIVEI